MEVSERQLKMLKAEEFDKLFEQEINQAETYEQAYERLEREYQQAFGERRYSSYDSFRISRHKRRKQALEQEM